MKIPRPSGGSRQSAGVGKIYIKYDTPESAKKALQALAGRKFADRTVVTTYFDEVRTYEVYRKVSQLTQTKGKLRSQWMVVNIGGHSVAWSWMRSGRARSGLGDLVKVGHGGALQAQKLWALLLSCTLVKSWRFRKLTNTMTVQFCRLLALTPMVWIRVVARDHNS